MARRHSTPTKDTRAHFGPGAYAWSKRADAEEYHDRLQRKVAEPLQIIEFRVWNCCLRKFRQLDVNSIPEPDIDHMDQQAQLTRKGAGSSHTVTSI